MPESLVRGTSKEAIEVIRDFAKADVLRDLVRIFENEDMMINRKIVVATLRSVADKYTKKALEYGRIEALGA